MDCCGFESGQNLQGEADFDLSGQQTKVDPKSIVWTRKKSAS
jgi:hypothetical protein